MHHLDHGQKRSARHAFPQIVVPQSPSDGSITINADSSLGGDSAKPPVSPNVDDLDKAENFIDNAYVEAILDGNKSQYSNLVKDIETDYDSQLTQLSLKEVF